VLGVDRELANSVVDMISRGRDHLYGRSVLRLLSQLVRLLSGKCFVSTYPDSSIPVHFRFPSGPDLFFALGEGLTLTYLQFYALAGAQHFALQVEGAAVFGIVHIE
jgi:hypothetical protein